MRRMKAAFMGLVAGISCLTAAAQYTEADIYAYIERYQEPAINKMYEYKIPASITIAQGIFESACGMSHLATDGNNHFGIKCHKEWTGDTILIDDDELQECFRKYATVEESFNDHSLFLKTRPRYSALFDLDVMDYAGWANGLKAAGYATNPEYATRLIRLIETYHIARLDTIYQERLASGYFKNYPDVQPPVTAKEPAKPAAQSAPTNDDSRITPEPAKPHKPHKPAKQNPQDTPPAPTKPTPATPNGSAKTTEPAPTPSQTTTPAPKPDENAADEVAARDEKPTALTVFSALDGEYPRADYPFTDRAVYANNRTLFVIAQKGDTYAKIARDVQDKEARLKKYNDATGNAKLKVGQVVYIEKKNNSGKEPYYKVVNSESLLYISQKTAISLKRLCKYNNIPATEKLKKDRMLKLKK
ncbi:MAG: glucosaminidase domain-containing protein [Bacteroidales bacterium]|nr:glucosaminidase domain-containing protein [Bacteroidales bacterium]